MTSSQSSVATSVFQMRINSIENATAETRWENILFTDRQPHIHCTNYLYICIYKYIYIYIYIYIHITYLSIYTYIKFDIENM